MSQPPPIRLRERFGREQSRSQCIFRRKSDKLAAKSGRSPACPSGQLERLGTRDNTLAGWMSALGRRDASCVRQKICFEGATAFSLPLLLKKGGEGRGEEALFINYPSLRLSPRSFLAGRERQNAASVLRAEHNRRDARPTPAFHSGYKFPGNCNFHNSTKV